MPRRSIKPILYGKQKKTLIRCSLLRLLFYSFPISPQLLHSFDVNKLHLYPIHLSKFFYQQQKLQQQQSHLDDNAVVVAAFSVSLNMVSSVFLFDCVDFEKENGKWLSPWASQRTLDNLKICLNLHLPEKLHLSVNYLTMFHLSIYSFVLAIMAWRY